MSDRIAMKRMIVALGLVLAGVFVAVGTPANATPAPPWVLYKTLPDSAACNSARYYFQQQGTIKGYLCDEISPPSASAAGDVQLWVVF
jgi:hypothetical protein